MGWGNNTNITTTHLDSSSDDPSLARAEILAAVNELQAVIAGRNTANGVAPTDGDNRVPNTNLPDNIVSSSGNNLLLQPDTGVVYVNYLLKIQDKSTSNLSSLTPTPYQLAMVSDGTPDRQCLAVYVGDNDGNTGDPIFYRIPLQNRIGNVGSIYSLDPITVSDLNAQEGLREGDVAYCSNGDAGDPCLAVYTGSQWLRIALGNEISET